MERNIGLIGATSIIVGLVIGAGAFVLPGALAGSTGPAAFLAILVAAIPAVFVGLFNAQLGSALPATGGNYVYISRLVSPRFGFLIAWMFIIQAIAATTLVASGFSGYVTLLVDIPPQIGNVGLVIGFLLLNIVGLQVAKQAQIAMVLFIVGTILLYAIPGLQVIDAANYQPLFPRGVSPLFAAVGSFYFSYIGVTAITELGGEIKNPTRNLPLSLGLSIGIVALLYTALVFTLVGVENWQQLGNMDAAIAETSQLFLPSWMTTVITLGAIVAIATTINATFAALSRTIMRAGRERALPRILGDRHDRFGTPLYALLLIGLPSIVLVGIDPGLPFVSTIAVLVILLTNFLLGIALYRLPEAYPEQYQNADFHVGETPLKILIGLGLVATLAFAVMTALGSYVGTGLTVAWLVLGLGAYEYRCRRLEDANYDLVERMSGIHEIDEENA
ncbi:APC family permease [Natrialbaceae archaeon A-gly3]